MAWDGAEQALKHLSDVWMHDLFCRRGSSALRCSPAPLQVFRHDPTLREVIQPRVSVISSSRAWVSLCEALWMRCTPSG